MEEVKSEIFKQYPSQLRLGHCLESSKHPWVDYSHECSDCITYTHFMIAKDDSENQTSIIHYHKNGRMVSIVRTPSIELSGLERGVKLPIEDIQTLDKLMKQYYGDIQ